LVKSKNEKAKAQLAVSIAYAFLSVIVQVQLYKSKKILKGLLSHSNQLIRQLGSYNLSHIEKNQVIFPRNESCTLSYNENDKTIIDGVIPYKYIRTLGKFIDENQKATFYTELLPNSNVLVAHWEGQFILLQRISNPQIKAKGGLGVGNHSKVLFDNLEDSDFSVLSEQKGYFVYINSCKLIFKINSQEIIEEWAKVF